MTINLEERESKRESFLLLLFSKRVKKEPLKKKRKKLIKLEKIWTMRSKLHWLNILRESKYIILNKRYQN